MRKLQLGPMERIAARGGARAHLNPVVLSVFAITLLPALLVISSVALLVAAPLCSGRGLAQIMGSLPRAAYLFGGLVQAAASEGESP